MCELGHQAIGWISLTVPILEKKSYRCIVFRVLSAYLGVLCSGYAEGLVFV